MGEKNNNKKILKSEGKFLKDTLRLKLYSLIHYHCFVICLLGTSLVR